MRLIRNGRYDERTEALKSTKPTLVSIQYLRAIAAIGVVAYHASKALFNREGGLIPFEIGAAGVDLFFVISGFIMSYAALDGCLSGDRFLIKRLIRIFPLYFIATTCAYLLALALPRSFETLSSSSALYITSITFVPHFNPALQCIQPLVGQGWTLNYEMFFYIIFATALFLPNTHRLAIVSAAITACAALSLFYNGQNIFVLSYTNPITLEFCFGMWAYALFARQANTVSPNFVFALAVGSIVVAAAVWKPVLGDHALSGCTPQGLLGSGWRFLLVGVPSALLLSAALSLEGAGRLGFNRLLYMIGEASYSLYLSHTFVLAILRRVWQNLFDITTLTSHVCFMLVAIVSCTLAAWVLFVMVERPMTVHLNRVERANLKPAR